MTEMNQNPEIPGEAIREQLDPLMLDPSPGYNDWLRARLEAEKSERPSRMVRLGKWSFPVMAAAAAVVFFLSLAVHLFFRGGGVPNILTPRITMAATMIIRIISPMPGNLIIAPD